MSKDKFDPMMAVAQSINRIETQQKELIQFVSGLRDIVDALDGVVFYAFAKHFDKNFKYTDTKVKAIQDNIQKVKEEAQKYQKSVVEEKEDGGDKQAD